MVHGDLSDEIVYELNTQSKRRAYCLVITIVFMTNEKRVSCFNNY